jgi:glycosyltransferase involved in cell wall biosynthesis
MRILKVTQVYCPYLDKGGPAVKVPALARHLACRGHQVTVLTSHYGWPLQAVTGMADGVEVVYLSYVARYHDLTLNPGAAQFCVRRLHEFDLVHIYGLYDLLGPIVALFCRRADVPYVIEPMGMMRPIDRNLRLKRLWHAAFGRQSLLHASCLIATSEQEHRALVGWGFAAEKVVIRHNGLDLDQFQQLPPFGTFRREWGIEPEEPLVLFLSRLIPRKGADLLIGAFAAACPRRGRLVLAGPEGERGYSQFLQGVARAAGLEDRVIFTGALHGDRKKAALADANVFALPSRYENFANAAAEAIACGRPVIVTDRCGISELVDQQAGLVIPYDRQALTEAIQRLLEDKSLYARCTAACREVAKRFSWPPLTERMESCYFRVLATSNASR